MFGTMLLMLLMLLLQQSFETANTRERDAAAMRLRPLLQRLLQNSR